MAEAHELKHVQMEGDSVGSKEDIPPPQYSNEAYGPAGNKAHLRRNFGFMSILGFSCTALITWEGMLILFGIGLTNGGDAGLIYGFLFVWIGTLSVFTCLAELASMAPTSAGQYYWVSLLAPNNSRKYTSYINGWLAVCGWQAAVASGGFATGSFIQALIEVCNPSYVPQPWHTMLLFWAVIAFCILVNAVFSSWLPKFEATVLVLHIIGFFAILLPLVIMSDHDTAQDVFTSFYNGGMFPSDGLSFFVGLLGNVFAFVGADGACHMSEEVKNPTIIVPRSIVLSILINGSLGFGMLIAVLFCLGDINAALELNPGFPLIGIFYNSTGSLPGAVVMSAILIILAVCSTLALMAGASRQLFAFARDKAVPGWAHLRKIEPWTQVPLWAVIATTMVSVLLSLIILGSSVAFNDIVALSISGLYASYLIAASLLCWRRCTGYIQFHDLSDFDRNTGPVNIPGQALIWGPWRIPGVMGLINNVFAIIYLIIVLFFSFWPSVFPVTDPSLANYASVEVVGVWFLATVYYFVWARRNFRGPQAAHLHSGGSDVNLGIE